METANGTTERLAEYLGQQTGIHVTEETVRVSFHAHAYVCKRSTWKLRRKADEKTDDVGNACGERFFSPGQLSPNLSPLLIWLRLTSGISFPPTWLMCLPCCHTLICICKMDAGGLSPHPHTHLVSKRTTRPTPGRGACYSEA